MAVLVTGGAGYIGSHMVARLRAADRDVVVVDDLSSGHIECIRDYIHVMDLADAHLAALEYLERGGESGAFNLGTGTGHSVAEVIDACRRVTGASIAVHEGPRRDGDPPSLVAGPSLAQARFGWRATRSSIDRIVSDAWAARRSAAGAIDVTTAIEPTAASPGRGREEERANVR